MVWPSAGDLATNASPMEPVAPGRFSTTTGWPRLSARRLPMARAKVSLEPPGGEVTTKRICLEGKVWANAAADASANAAAARRAKDFGVKGLSKDGIKNGAPNGSAVSLSLTPTLSQGRGSASAATQRAGDELARVLLEPLADAVGVADAREAAPRVEQHDDDRLVRDHRLHHQAFPGLADVAGLRESDLPVRRAHQRVGVHEGERLLRIGKRHVDGARGRVFLDELVLRGFRHQVPQVVGAGDVARRPARGGE